jgi:hypothetical protein
MCACVKLFMRKNFLRDGLLFLNGSVRSCGGVVWKRANSERRRKLKIDFATQIYHTQFCSYIDYLSLCYDEASVNNVVR